MAINQFDQASRYAAKTDSANLLAWFMRDDDQKSQFTDWIDARNLPFPGEPERVCDTVAEMTHAERSGKKWLVVLEFQSKPDKRMFGRLLIYLGQLWLEHFTKKYRVGAVVVNLTGKGQTATRRMRFGTTDVRTQLTTVERNLASESATDILTQIETGSAPRSLLMWIPLMKGGASDDVIQRWLTLAEVEPDDHKRSTYGGIAKVFAELKRGKEKWRQALEGWNVLQSETINGWLAEGRAEGERNHARKMLLAMLKQKFGKVPVKITRQIESHTNVDELNAAQLACLNWSSISDFTL